MSIQPEERVFEHMGIGEAHAQAVGPERAAQIRAFRLILHISQELRFLTDQLYRADGLTTQQATLLTAVRTLGRPALSELAAALATSHQNVKQLIAALARKGFVRLAPDPDDARVKRVLTTPKNTRHWSKRDPSDFERVSEWFAALDHAETALLARLLAKLQIGLPELVRGAQAPAKASARKRSSTTLRARARTTWPFATRGRARSRLSSSKKSSK